MGEENVTITKALVKSTGLCIPKNMVKNDDDVIKSNRNGVIKSNRDLLDLFLFYRITV